MDWSIDKINSQWHACEQTATAKWRALDETQRLCASAGGGAVCLALGIGVGTRVRANTLRYLVAKDIPMAAVRRNVTLKGRVVKVVDGDTFRMQHTPKWSLWSRPVSTALKLSESTITVRLAGTKLTRLSHRLSAA